MKQQLWTLVGWWYRLWHQLTAAPAWRIEYPDGHRSVLMGRQTCQTYAAIFGGEAVYCGEDYLLWKYGSEPTEPDTSTLSDS